MELFHQLPTVLQLSHKSLYSHQHYDLEDSIPDDLDVNTNKYADDCTEDQHFEQAMSSFMQVATDFFCKWAGTNKIELNKKN